MEYAEWNCAQSPNILPVNETVQILRICDATLT